MIICPTLCILWRDSWEAVCMHPRLSVLVRSHLDAWRDAVQERRLINNSVSAISSHSGHVCPPLSLPSDAVVFWGNIDRQCEGDLLFQFLLPRDVPITSCIPQETIWESIFSSLLTFSFFSGIYSRLFSIPDITSLRCWDADSWVYDAASCGT